MGNTPPRTHSSSSSSHSGHATSNEFSLHEVSPTILFPPTPFLMTHRNPSRTNPSSSPVPHEPRTSQSLPALAQTIAVPHASVLISENRVDRTSKQRKRHRVFRVTDDGISIDNPQTRAHTHLRRVELFETPEQINYAHDPDDDQIINRIAPLPDQLQTNYVVDYIEDDEDFEHLDHTYVKWGGGIRSVHRLGVVVYEAKCLGTFVCRNRNCPCFEEYTVRATKGQTDVICESCQYPCTRQSCDAFMGRITWTHPRTVDGRDVKSLFRIGAHHQSCLRYKYRMTPSVEAQIIRELAVSDHVPEREDDFARRSSWMCDQCIFKDLGV